MINYHVAYFYTNSKTGDMGFGDAEVAITKKMKKRKGWSAMKEVIQTSNPFLDIVILSFHKA